MSRASLPGLLVATCMVLGVGHAQAQESLLDPVSSVRAELDTAGLTPVSSVTGQQVEQVYQCPNGRELEVNVGFFNAIRGVKCL